MTSATKTERRLDWRRRTLLGAWLLACILLVARAVELQLLEGSEWRAVADGQHKLSVEVPAPRGAILDRDGAPLAVSRENFKVSVAPRELTDAADMRVLLTETLGISGRTARRATDDTRKWVVVPGVFGPSVRDALSGVRGVYLERVLRRDHPYEDLAMGVLGRVLDGAGAGGIEQAFDSILSGRPGREVLARDSEGKPLPGQVFEMEPPVPGGDVTLTIDVDLQEIASQALREAVEAHGARGGDIIVSDPFTGDILSLVSMSEGRTDALSAIHTPYEPGSTLKPFTVAAILQHRRGSLQDSIDVENGSWAVNGRVLNDVHASGVMSLADALRISSNVGVAKAAQALAPRDLAPRPDLRKELELWSFP